MTCPPSREKPSTNGRPRTVEDLARAKRLPVAFLRELGVEDLPGGGVAIPYRDVDGADLYRRERDRPGGPRFRQPAGVRLRPYGLDRLDAARRVGHAYLTEGESDTWALWHHGLPALGLPGSNTAKVLETEYLAGLDTLYLLPDADQAGERMAEGVERRLADLRWGGRLFRVRLPDGVKDASDWHGRDPERFTTELAQAVAAAEPMELATAGTTDRPAGRLAPDPAGRYRVAGGCIVHARQVRDGTVDVPLCNFAARIVEQVTVDDGAECGTRFALEGSLSDGTPLPRADVSAKGFQSLDWIVPAWGVRAVVYAGQGARDHLRAALQLLSGDVPCRTAYGHAGWREVGGRWLYLHAGGAVGADGPVDGIEVSLPEALAGYLLPAPPSGEGLAAAVRASLRLLGLAPERITYPLLAAVYRAALGGSDFALHLSGPSGAFKTELAALAQQHYGAGLDARHLPGSWSSTGNSLEALAFAAKDALFCVDDFAPAGGAADVQRLHREAERLLRAQGNSAGRQRMRSDGGLRPARPPRGLVLSTGEDVPRGQSLRARLLVLELGPGDVDLARLTACQQDAAAGLYVQALAGFARWLAPRYGEARGRLRGEMAELRGRATSGGQHARTPGIVADLALGLRSFLDYARQAGAVDEARHAELWARGWAALCEAGAAQAEHVQAAEPTGHYLRLLAAALASGRAHVAAPDGGCPDGPAAWGWRDEDARDGPAWRPQGRRVGWLDGEQLLLEPEASFAAAQALAGEQGDGLAISPRTLRRRLRERGLLASVGGGRETLTVRRTLDGKRREVLHLHAASLFSGPDQPDQPPANAEENGRAAGRVAGRDGPDLTPDLTTGTDQPAGENGRLVGLVRSGAGREAAPGATGPKGWTAPGLGPDDLRTPFDDE
jgi:hypothetical protein